MLAICLYLSKYLPVNILSKYITYYLSNISPRAGKPYGILGKTSIFKHFLDTRHKVLSLKFEVISSAVKNNIFLLENIYIHQLKRSIHGTLYYTPLSILN